MADILMFCPITNGPHCVQLRREINEFDFGSPGELLIHLDRAIPILAFITKPLVERFVIFSYSLQIGAVSVSVRIYLVHSGELLF